MASLFVIISQTSSRLAGSVRLYARIRGDETMHQPPTGSNGSHVTPKMSRCQHHAAGFVGAASPKWTAFSSLVRPPLSTPLALTDPPSPRVIVPGSAGYNTVESPRTKLSKRRDRESGRGESTRESAGWCYAHAQPPGRLLGGSPPPGLKGGVPERVPTPCTRRLPVQGFRT